MSQKLGVRGAIINGAYIPGDISLEDGKIAEVGLPAGGSGLAIPGFVDLQVNGFGGVDFSSASPESWLDASQKLLRTGVTHYLANIVSNDVSTMGRAIQMAKTVKTHDNLDGAELIGVHVEGPFLAEAKSGVHPREHLKKPDIETMREWITQGPVTMVTLAPELPGAIEAINFLSGSGVAVSLGHSDCNAAQANAGFEAGATAVTHIFNAMSGMSARNPGLSGVALNSSDVWVQLIADFTHVDKILMELLIKLAPKRMVLVTDCLSVTGTSGTHFTLGDRDISIVEGKAVNSDGVLAGSLLTMGEALRNAVACGMPEVDAVNATSRNPLLLTNPQSPPLLAPGMPADLLVVSDSLDVESVFLRAKEIAG
jgi:N-acetylglucosamine-6-phosphate deacetylase